MAAVFHGAPVVTYDLDVLHARTPENFHGRSLLFVSSKRSIGRI
jgi:hypothetical protein